MAAPHWSLARIKALVAAGDFFLQRAKAFDPLVAHCGSPSEARAFVDRAVARLSEQNFARTVALTFDVCDEYGLVFEGSSWYIKVYVDESQPEATFISFHRPQFQLRTRGGIVRP